MLWSCCRFYTPFGSVWVQGLCYFSFFLCFSSCCRFKNRFFQSRELQGLAFLDRLANRLKQNLNQITIRQQSTNEKQTSIPVTPRIIPFSKCFMTMVIVSNWGYSPSKWPNFMAAFPFTQQANGTRPRRWNILDRFASPVRIRHGRWSRRWDWLDFFGVDVFFWQFREVTHRNEGFGK